MDKQIVEKHTQKKSDNQTEAEVIDKFLSGFLKSHCG